MVFKSLLIFLATVIVILAGFYLYLWSLQGRKSDSKHPYLNGRQAPLTFAHRGGMKEAPENTLVAFERAKDSGIDVLELDVRLSSDGEIIVFHDSTLNRTTDGSGEVASKTYKELRKLNAAAKSADSVRAHIPTLREVFETFPDTPINIEHKRTPVQFTDKLCALIREFEREETVIVASVSDDVIKQFRRECPGVPTSASFWETTSFLVLYYLGLSDRFTAEMDAIQIPAVVTGTGDSLKNFVDAAKERNLEVHIFTVNETERAKEAIGSGVGGIMTDYPKKLSDYLHF